MAMDFHEGERQVQRLAGVVDTADQVGKMIRDTLPSTALEFLRGQVLAVAGSVSEDGRVWASLLTGQPGFLRATGDRTLQIVGSGPDTDPLWENLRNNPEMGLLVIDLAARRRLRINGTAEVLATGKIHLTVRQAFGNCPKYIQRREVIAQESANPARRQENRQRALSEAQQQWVERADTFFIASVHGGSGADASHRGGHPGFLQVVNPTTVVWPDYGGNSMFQTLGNLAIDTRAGLLVVDWSGGGTLQMTGRARVIWDQSRVASYPGAERLVEYEVEEVREMVHASPLRWRLLDPSPYNPPVEGRGP
jgi:predicted pyridoxine 5'-phosphate oxidase superfamily flavin-nucleotide-binding protein